MRQLIEGRQATPPPYGLLVAAETINDPDPRWALGGATWDAEAALQNDQSGVLAMLTCAEVGDMDPTVSAFIREQTPFLVWAADKCSTFGFDARDYVGRATRALLARQSFEIAYELWTGAVASTLGEGTPPGGSAWFTNADVATQVTSAAVAPTVALSCVEQYLADVLRGQRGMVHMTPGMLTQLFAAGAVYKDGKLWVTANGHVVVADAGYPGFGEGDESVTAAQWIVGTDMVQVRLGPIEVLPSEFAAAVDRSVNTVRFYAQRPSLVQWDAFAAGFAEVNVGNCQPLSPHS